MKKQLLLILFLVWQSLTGWSQTTQITSILNKELKKEIRAQSADEKNYQNEKFEVAKQFSIRDSAVNSSENKADNNQKPDKEKILSLTVKKKNYNNEELYTETQEVALSQIKAIVKDINVIFETEDGAVTVTQTNEKGKTSKFTRDMFFLQLSYDKQNESLADELIKAFKKSGYTITKGFWYD